MATPRIEDHALLSDQRSCALVTREGTIDWLCLPRIDSDAIFTSLLGTPEHGHWTLRIVDGEVLSRRYLPGSMVLETTWRSPTGRAIVTELMPVPAAPSDARPDPGDGDGSGGDDAVDGSGGSGDADAASADQADLIRTVTCTDGEIEVISELVIRFEYGQAVPWVRRGPDRTGEDALIAVAGGDGLVLHGPRLHPDGHRHRGRLRIAADGAGSSSADGTGAGSGAGAGAASADGAASASWVLTWFPSWQPVPAATEVGPALESTLRAWTRWLDPVRQHADRAARPSAPATRPSASPATRPLADPATRPSASPATRPSADDELVQRSLLTLKALTHRDTGGIVAAATTSLPEDFGGVRNWDYRFCWLRDAALSLTALLDHGHVDAAISWREWLLRAIAGDPERLQIMYAVTGDRELREQELAHLPGYEGSAPVRIGNGAADQYQADVVGEVMIALDAMRGAGIEESPWSWPLQKALLRFAVAHLDEGDQGIWEMRGDPAFFTHGRVMTWAAFDRGVQAVERDGLPASDAELARWRDLRDRLREEVLTRGVGPDGAFTQTLDGPPEVDASLLQIPRTGFLAADDPRMLATVARIEQDLAVGDQGLILRYRTRGSAEGVDGLPGDEHPFLVCCFWLVEQHAASGRLADAERLLETLLGCANDLGLLAEEYDVGAARMAGNFPQAFSHLGLVRAVDAVAAARRAAATARRATATA